MEGTLRCKVIALALGQRAPDFPTRRDFQAVLWCGVGLKVMYVDPLRWGTPGLRGALGITPVRRFADPRRATYCIVHRETRAERGRCREGLWASQNRDRGENLGRHKFTRTQNALLWVKKPNPLLFCLGASF